jgi:hypothetical protein
MSAITEQSLVGSNSGWRCRIRFAGGAGGDRLVVVSPVVAGASFLGAVRVRRSAAAAFFLTVAFVVVSVAAAAPVAAAAGAAVAIYVGPHLLLANTQRGSPFPPPPQGAEERNRPLGSAAGPVLNFVQM